MKVIAIMNNREFLVRADKDELANIAGYFMASSPGAPRVDIGTEINVSDVYRQIHHLQESHDIEVAVESLKQLIDSLVAVDDVVGRSPLTENERKKED
jgi:hypothetical protein